MKKIIIVFLLLLSFSIIFSAQNQNNDDNVDIRTRRLQSNIPPDDSFIDLSQNLQNNEDERAGYTLPMIIKKILSNSPMLSSSRSMEDYYLARIKQIKSERDPAIFIETAFLPVPNIPTPETGKTWRIITERQQAKAEVERRRNQELIELRRLEELRQHQSEAIRRRREGDGTQTQPQQTQPQPQQQTQPQQIQQQQPR